MVVTASRRHCVFALVKTFVTLHEITSPWGTCPFTHVAVCISTLVLVLESANSSAFVAHNEEQPLIHSRCWPCGKAHRGK
eukprot:6046914-Amphidinium_carterae.1